MASGGALFGLGEAEAGSRARDGAGGVSGHGAEFGDAVDEGFGGYVCCGGEVSGI